MANKKQEAFCLAYVKKGDIVQAARESGYKERFAVQLLKSEAICQRLRELSAVESSETASGLTEKVVIEYLQDIYRICMKPLEEKGEKPVFDARGALRAVELMGRYLGMFGNGLSVENNIALPVIIDDI